jgi:MFS family permease
MILCPVIMAVGLGLMSTFQPDTESANWIAYQFLTGFGLGFGMQTVGLAVQTVLPIGDVSTGIAISFFGQQLGAAIFISVGQAILSNLLVSQLSQVPGLHPEVIINSGATDLHDVVPDEFYNLVVNAYNFACSRIFLTGTVLCVLTLTCALCMEWKSIKKDKRGGPPGNGPAGPVGPPTRPPPGPPPGPPGPPITDENSLPRGAVKTTERIVEKDQDGASTRS